MPMLLKHLGRWPYCSLCPKTYDTLWSLLASTLPQDKTFPELLVILKENCDPKPLVIGERFHFYRQNQKANKTIAEFLADLLKLSIHCEFGTFLIKRSVTTLFVECVTMLSRRSS